MCQEWTWRSLDSRIEARIITCFKSWEGTPYRMGQQAKQMGTDCVHLTSALLDELYRRPRTHIPRSMGTMGQSLTFRRSFPLKQVRDKTLEPGDVVLVRSGGGEGPDRVTGHILMAGSHPMSAIHAVHLGNVSITSLIYEILKVYRPQNKESWI